ncbi:DUF5808 domain-containing protein [Neobacillus drentensis]|uniref:DUF5808 domain-containing protein n=1 Tax=Neobacillus drentensis TaxID=220684 RepID=UPI002FFDED8C
MGKRKWSNKEIEEFRKRNGKFVYYNKEDANLFVPKALGFGWTLNWANPLSWLVILLIFGIIIFRHIFK